MTSRSRDGYVLAMGRVAFGRGRLASRGAWLMAGAALAVSGARRGRGPGRQRPPGHDRLADRRGRGGRAGVRGRRGSRAGPSPPACGSPAGRRDVADRFADRRRRGPPSGGAGGRARHVPERATARRHTLGIRRSRGPGGVRTWFRSSGCRCCSSRSPWCRCCRGESGVVAAFYPAWAALVIAVRAACSWLADQGVIDVDRATINVGYELAMAVGGGRLRRHHPRPRRPQGALNDWVLGDERLAGLDGLAVVSGRCSAIPS